MKAVTYRYSAAENPTWLDQQEADCRRYADEHGMTVTEVFTDVGRSRYGLQGVLDAVEREDETGLIVTDLARLGSKYADHLATVQRLQEAGVTILVTKEKTTDGRGALLTGVKQTYVEFQERHDDPLASDGRDD